MPFCPSTNAPKEDQLGAYKTPARSRAVEQVMTSFFEPNSDELAPAEALLKSKQPGP